MYNNSKGITLVECMIAVFLTAIAVISLMTMQPLSWKSAGKSDYLGRAAGILQREQEARLNYIMRGTTPLLAASTNNQTITEGNITYTLVTTISIPAPNKWAVNVKVTWPNTVKGITSSMLVTRQMGFNSADVYYY